MKKIFISFLTMIIVLSMTISSYAAETKEKTEQEGESEIETKQPKIEVNFEQVETEDEKTVKFVISLGNFEEIEENIIVSYETVLNYDEDVFEEVQATDVEGKGKNSSAKYKPDNKKIIGLIDSVKANTNIAEITLRVKENVTADKQTTVSLDGFWIADEKDNVYEGYELSKTIVVNKSKEEEKQDPIQSEKEVETKNKNNETTEEKEIDKTLAQFSSLPKTGQALIIAVALFLIVILVMGVISGKEYLSYLKDTHKQIKK